MSNNKEWPNQSRYKGQFSTKRKKEWKEKVIVAIKRRCTADRAPAENNSERLSGRRIIHLELLAKELWCTSCDIPLSLRHVSKEERIGLASIFNITCQQCQITYAVHTSKREKSSVNTKPTYTVNTKVVIGTLESGIGETHLNKILSEMNIPTIYNSTFKRCERKAGKSIELLADASCLENLKLERALTITNEKLNVLPDWSEENIVFITASYDAGWQKKGSGRSYNSLTGHGTAIGYYSKKVIAYGTRVKRCIFCEKQSPPKEHDCCLNYKGSSKSMEADIAVEIFLNNKNFDAAKVKLGTLIGDDDSSTICRLRRESNHRIAKWTDKNHAVTKLSKSLYALKSLKTPVIEYFKYCFGCVLEKNKMDAEATRQGILAITPHAFDDHSSCGQWCKFKECPENYKHKLLPGGKGLTGEELKLSIQRIFVSFANQAEKLAPCGSSQANESLNRMIASTNPKASHYGGSSSSNIRVGTAVLKKNVGSTHVMQLHTHMQTSPLSSTAHKYRQQIDRVHKLRANIQKSIEFKKRRRELIAAKSHKNIVAGSKEGITYDSACGIDVGIDFIDKPVSDTRTIVPEHATVVIFDLETSGLGRKCEILQIAARFEETEFNAYIMPLHSISSSASAVTGLEIINGDLVLDAVPVTTVSPRIAVSGLLSFLRSCAENIVLIAHNGLKFDAPLLMKLVREQGMFDEFIEVVYGFADTLPIIRNKLKERRSLKASFKQSILVQEYLGPDAAVGAHNALHDVAMLQKLLEHPDIDITNKEILENTTTIKSFIASERESLQCNIRKASLECLKQVPNPQEPDNKSSGISMGMITKIAKAGITISDILQSYHTSDRRGIEILLGQDIGGRPRVTKSNKIFTNLCSKLAELSRKNSIG